MHFSDSATNSTLDDFNFSNPINFGINPCDSKVSMVLVWSEMSRFDIVQADVTYGEIEFINHKFTLANNMLRPHLPPISDEYSLRT